MDDWRAAYADLFALAARELDGVPGLDLTAELITHRFTPKSKAVIQGWYPGTKLDLDEAKRSRKLTKFGSVKHVYPARADERDARRADGSACRSPSRRQGPLLDLMA